MHAADVARSIPGLDRGDRRSPDLALSESLQTGTPGSRAEPRIGADGGGGGAAQPVRVVRGSLSLRARGNLGRGLALLRRASVARCGSWYLSPRCGPLQLSPE